MGSGVQLLVISGLNTSLAMDQGEMELFRIQTEVYRRALEARETLESFSQSMAIEQRVEMYVLVLVAICLCILFKILNVNNSPEKSMFYCSNQKFLEEFLKKAPELAEPYIPTRFWGYSGHLQTIIQGVISRLHRPLVNGHRVSLKLTDGATVTYDLYHAIEAHPGQGDFTLCVCPGIGNNSESVYIRRVVYNAQLNGYRVVVLNHIGTLHRPCHQPQDLHVREHRGLCRHDQGRHQEVPEHQHCLCRLLHGRQSDHQVSRGASSQAWERCGRDISVSGL